MLPDEDYESIDDMLDRLHERTLDYYWSPFGRQMLRQRAAGVELRDRVALGGREIEDVPLPP